MSDSIKFTGRSTLKGRNGYTMLGSADTFASMRAPNSELECTRYICFHSSRPRGGVGTALLELNREDFIAFQQWITNLQFEDTRSAREIKIGGQEKS